MAMDNRGTPERGDIGGSRAVISGRVDSQVRCHCAVREIRHRPARWAASRSAEVNCEHENISGLVHVLPARTRRSGKKSQPIQYL
jgi:hypothetical protein